MFVLKSRKEGSCLKIEIRELCRQDYAQAIQFASTGMHFSIYFKSQFMLHAYSRYFWYSELNRSTQMLAACVDGRFEGVLLAEVRGEKRKHSCWYEKLYVIVFELLQRVVSRNGAGLYENTVKIQRAHYLKTTKADGEILFLAADPDCQAHGIGTALLQELERREKGKTIYLVTDDECTWQFYECRGFQRMEEQDIVMDMPIGKVPLKCLLYSKIM